MKRMSITFGDFYGDGHKQFETFYMLCNKTGDELKGLESKFEQDFGFKFQTNGPNIPSICNEYCENEVPEYIVDKLTGFGMDMSVEDSDAMIYNFENGIPDFAEFFMRALKLADDTLEWKWCEKDEKDVIFNCRGYGLFY